MTDTTLLPCPHCGKSVAVVTTAFEMWPEHEEGNAESYAVMCDAHRPGGPGGCGASGGFFSTETEAIAAWNRRPSPSVHRQASADANELCPGCHGSGEQQFMTQHLGPNDYEVAGQCSKCGGSGVVDDGFLTHSEGGIRYENGPIKCVKDCPSCKGSGSTPQSRQASAGQEGVKPSTEAPKPAAPVFVPGFDPEMLSDMADGLDCYEKTVNVGAAIEPGMDVHLESTTAAAARFIRAYLNANADALDELRQACAKILREDPEVWPRHGDAALGIRSAMSLLAMVVRKPARQTELRRAAQAAYELLSKGPNVRDADYRVVTELAAAIDAFPSLVAADFSGDFVEHSHPEFGGGYFCTPDVLANILALSTAAPESGWRLVPVEATEAMVLAGARANGSRLFAHGSTKPLERDGPRTREQIEQIKRSTLATFNAMLAAAPNAGETL